MAYMRGETYVYSDGEHLHIYRPWRSLSLPLETAQELAAMLWHRTPENERHALLERTHERWGGNFGCAGVAKALGKPTAWDEVLAELDTTTAGGMRRSDGCPR